MRVGLHIGWVAGLLFVAHLNNIKRSDIYVGARVGKFTDARITCMRWTAAYFIKGTYIGLAEKMRISKEQQICIHS